MELNEFSELAEVRFRGLLAGSFSRANMSPGEYWPYIRGEREITMRVVGEVAHLTGFDFEVQFWDRQTVGAKTDD